MRKNCVRIDGRAPLLVYTWPDREFTDDEVDEYLAILRKNATIGASCVINVSHAPVPCNKQRQKLVEFLFSPEAARYRRTAFILESSLQVGAAKVMLAFKKVPGDIKFFTEKDLIKAQEWAFTRMEKPKWKP